MMSNSWICCQLGAREHYSIPRCLHRSGRLDRLVTDSWHPANTLPGRLAGKISARFLGRYHPDLPNAAVRSFNRSSTCFEISQRARRSSDWDRIIARNDWFQARVLNTLPSLLSGASTSPKVLFSYSYTARELFRKARDLGIPTVLGQIDPGPVEEELIRREHEAHPEYGGVWHPAPAFYWDRWREECALADRIIVNSQWSRDALEKEGVAPGKITIIPLAYEPPPGASAFERRFPDSFSPGRPLRVLFLGQLVLRKGIHHVIEAARLLEGLPVEFQFVGPSGIRVPEAARQLRNVRWIGAIPRSEVHNYYRNADVFLFPTLSDGFGLTQIEAAAWKLPHIVSRRCGEVVEHGKSGIILDDVTPETIMDAVRDFLDNPPMLAEYSQSSSQAVEQFSLDQLTSKLLALHA